SCISLCPSVSFQSSADPRDLHSFPTRRSSDLLAPVDDVAEKAFALIREGLKAKKVAALAKAVLFRRARTLMIRPLGDGLVANTLDRKSTRLNSSHVKISYAVFCLKKKKKKEQE